MSFLSQITEESSSQADDISVLVLGPLRLVLKTEQIRIPFPANGSQDVFLDSMLKRFPDLHSMLGAVRLARNHQFLLPEEKLEPGDEVALIPPVSGG